MAGAKKRGSDRASIVLSCTQCGARNYKTTKSPTFVGQLSLKKFCKECDAHTLHIDTK